jgi:uncharacterized protein involved in response to NO
MMAPVPRLRPYPGPALLSYGFRPFFLLGSLYAGTAVLLWLPMFYGEMTVPTAFVPRDWHAHEMLFGYIAAVIADPREKQVLAMDRSRSVVMKTENLTISKT